MFPHAEMRPQTQMVIMMMWICKKKITHICTSLNIYHISSSGSYSKYRCSDVIHYLTMTFLLSSVRQWKTPGEPQKPHCDVHAPGCFNTLSVHSFIVPAAQTPPPLPPKVGIYASSPKNKITHTYGFKYVCTYSAQPKVRTSSEESVAGEDDRLRKSGGLQAPSPLLRTSSETRVRPAFHPRSSRNSGAFPHLYTQLFLKENEFPRSMNNIIFLLCDLDPATFPVQDSDRSADLVPPELPPKGIRRRKPISKVKNIIKTDL